MKLSVVIVNYNVRFFLEQCLLSVEKAMKGLSIEVFVVDNNSVDGSMEMTAEKFPWVKRIENKENVGFSKANNQAIVASSGEYILLLNPDTIIPDTTFQNIITFMDNTPDAGGLGVKMLNGQGEFLPESKRGLPTPATSLYKMMGLARLFPKSKVFAHYHLGYLDKNKIHKVDVLSGAFMLLRKSVLDKIGLLDETFFMYGEDIDLSYRITLAGYYNYYFPETEIIHYKGESTKKGSINYVLVFYNAMIIFAKKHFSNRHATLLTSIIQVAIYLRAFLAILKRFFDRIYLPLVDAVVSYSGLYLLKEFWEVHNQAHPIVYPPAYSYIVMPAYIVIWLLSCFFAGVYDRPVKWKKVFHGIWAGTLIILVIYALLNVEYRYSRAMILLGAIWMTGILVFLRVLYHMLGVKSLRFDIDKDKNYLLVGEQEELERVSLLLQHMDINIAQVYTLSASKSRINLPNFIGRIINIREIVQIYKVDVIVFCAKDIASSEIIRVMGALQEFGLEYKTVPPSTVYLIGSQSIHEAEKSFGEIKTVHAIQTNQNKRNKRGLDVLVSMVGVLGFPFWLFIIPSPFNFLRHCLLVFFGFKSWVGYGKGVTSFPLPAIREGVLANYKEFSHQESEVDDELKFKINILYARHYTLKRDIKIIVKNVRLLGQ